jgi:ribosomal protein L31E
MRRTRQNPFRKRQPRVFEMFGEVVKLRFEVELVVDRMSINSIALSEDL